MAKSSKINTNLVKVKYFHTKKKLKFSLKKYGINSEYINISIIKKLLLYIKTTEKYKLIYQFIKIFFDYNFFQSFLLKRKVDLVYFISPSRFAMDLNKLNFIFTVWDLCHREQVEFPEAKVDEEFENREFRLNYVLPRAVSVIVDSEYSKKSLQKIYNINKDRIKILPFEPSREINLNSYKKEDKIDTFKKYNIEGSYIFYPAQMWPHKNHHYILDGIYLLEKNYNLKIYSVFSGGNKGNKDKIIEYASKLNIIERIIFTGFISNKEIYSHYKNCLALVMPTYFGPTNIPPLEAFKVGTPVIYSNLKGLKDQVGDAALLMDLDNPISLTNNIYNLLKDKNLKNKLIKKGFKIHKRFDKYDRINLLNSIILDFRNKYITFN